MVFLPHFSKGRVGVGLGSWALKQSQSDPLSISPLAGGGAMVAPAFFKERSGYLFLFAGVRSRFSPFSFLRGGVDLPPCLQAICAMADRQEYKCQ